MPFVLADFACNCGCNGNETQQAIVDLCNAIEAQMPSALTLNSGYRCVAHNAAVGGVPNSQHRQGRAGDITHANIQQLRTVCEALWNSNQIGGLGIYNSFCHVDTGPHRRWQG